MTDPFGAVAQGPLFPNAEMRYNGKGYDPAPSVQISPVAAAVTSTAVGNTSLVFSGGASATAGVFGGTQIVLTGATSETVWVASNWSPGSSATVPLTSPLTQAGNTTANYNGFSSVGPVGNSFYGAGMPVTALATYDGASKFTLLRNGGSDGSGTATVASQGAMVFNGSTWDRARAATGDGLASTGLAAGGQFIFNGASWDRGRNNLAVNLLASGAQTVTYTSADQTNFNGAMLHLVCNVTAVSGTSPSMAVAVNGKDPSSGAYYPLVTSVAITAAGTTVLKVGPGFPATANVSANDMVPRVFQVTATISGTTPSFTMSLGYNLNE